MHALQRLLPAVLAVLVATSARAEVVSLQILKREPFAGGQAFGAAGPYEQITAIARFAIDPQDPVCDTLWRFSHLREPQLSFSRHEQDPGIGSQRRDRRGGEASREAVQGVAEHALRVEGEGGPRSSDEA